MEIEWVEACKEKVDVGLRDEIGVVTHVAKVPGGTLVRSTTYRYNTGVGINVVFVPDHSSSKDV